MDILTKCGWLSIVQLINVASVKLFRQIVMKHCPKLLFNLLKTGQNHNVNTRTVIKYYPKIKPLLSDTWGFFVNKICEIYNSLPIHFHYLKTDSFGKS